MKLWIRNLTKDKDMEVILPIDERTLDNIIHPNDEYIILDSEILDVGQYDSIDELNGFLFDCKENGVSLETLEVLSKVMLYHEVVEAVNYETYWIIDFDEETSNWYCGNGGDITNDSDKGMCLYDSGMYNPFPCEVKEELYDWIDWDSVWINATTEGWQRVSVNNHNYLVHR